jgi:hypothetical protein
MILVLFYLLSSSQLSLAAKSVESVDFSDRSPESFAQFLAGHDTPVIVRAASSPTEQFWGVRQLPWTLVYIAQHAPKNVLLQAKNSSNPRFDWGCCKLRGLYPELLVRKITSGKEYVYLSADIDKLQVEGREFFSGGILPKELLQVNEIQGEFKHLMWLGSKGVITPLHFDEMHNVFLQVEGVKRFTLFPPNAWRQLYLYPKFHVRHRNAMFEYPPNDETVEKEFPAYSLFPIEPFEAELNPGDVLYIPPLWFHQVEAISNSISFNVWSPVRDIEFMMMAWQQELPLKFEKYSAEKAVRVTSYFIQKFIEAALNLDAGAAEDFVIQNVESRYRRINQEKLDLMESDLVVEDDDEDHDKFDATIAGSPNLYKQSLEMKEHQSFIESVQKDSPPIIDLDTGSVLQLCSTYQVTNFKPKELKNLQRSAEKLSKFFQRGSEGLREIFVANFVEDLVARFVGENHVFDFMKYCVSAWLSEDESSAQRKDEL